LIGCFELPALQFHLLIIKATFMKKTSYIHLVLITAALASCSKPAYWRTPNNDESADSTASYTDTCVYDPTVDLWRYSFQNFLDDFFYYYPSVYYRGEFPASNNVTTMIHRPAIIRGGFGKTLAVVS
jgi:hypothetical protein